MAWQLNEIRQQEEVDKELQTKDDISVRIKYTLEVKLSLKQTKDEVIHLLELKKIKQDKMNNHLN